jgi:menaquinone-specific isochorismate synthase
MAISTEYLTGLTNLTSWLEKGVHSAHRQGRSLLVSYSKPVPAVATLQFFERARQRNLCATFWERSEDNFSLAGAGAALALEAHDTERFEKVEKQWQDFIEGALIEREAAPADLWGIGPALFGGFSFEDEPEPAPQWQYFPAALLRLPQVQLASRSDGCYLTLNALVDEFTDPAIEAEYLLKLSYQLTEPFSSEALAEATAAKNTPKGKLEDVKPALEWQELVSRAVREIGQGYFEKVVLAREVRLAAHEPFKVALALERLRQTYPAATIFAIADGQKCFLGATPERLVRLCEGEVRTVALAGTFPRGQTEQEDRQLGQELLDSPKNRHEHAIVVQMLRTALEKVCSHIWVDSEPHLLKLPNVQHLFTPVLGRLNSQAPASVLRLLKALHPTPAMGGFPHKAALSWLHKNEGLARGWYASPVGWVDSRGEGEFVVAIRSALVDGAEARLFAGCGIVEDSDPETEYSESCLKLRPMINALG